MKEFNQHLASMMTSDCVLKVASVAHLEDGGNGLVFEVQLKDHPKDMPNIPAFAVRYQGQVMTYKNICGHIAVNLDFVKGQFFDESGEFLVCSTHGALYKANTGKCMGGPCYGVGLEPIMSEENEGVLYIADSEIGAVII
jgi:nitrite reductase/ring-hydroxylating ferredoxin subunit